MGKLLLTSVLIVTIAVPMRAARDPSPARAFRRAMGWTAAYYAFYLVAIIYVLPRLG